MPSRVGHIHNDRNYNNCNNNGNSSNNNDDERMGTTKLQSIKAHFLRAFGN